MRALGESRERMEEDKLKEIIRDHKITVVHFSHDAVMAHRVVFPEDLKYAIDNYSSDTRSCCAIFPGHSMSLPGSVGVIFAIQNIEEILSVSCQDSGASDYSGSEDSMGVEPTENAITESLNQQVGSYNEWRIRGAKPIGIFVANPMNIMVKKEIKLNCAGEEFTEIGIDIVPLADIQAAFPDLPLYTMGVEGLEKLS